MSYLKNISEAIVRTIQQLKYIQKVYPMAQMYTTYNSSQNDTVSFPAVYLGNDQFDRINNFDKFQGVCYHRLDGLVTSTDEESVISGKTLTRMSYPLVLVICAPKVINGDDSYSEDRIYLDVVKSVNYLTKLVRESNNAGAVDITINSYNADRDAIESEEYVGIDNFRVRYKYSYLKISLTVALTVDMCDAPINC